MFLEVFSKQH